MITVIMLCAIMPDYGCLPFETMAACERARDDLAGIVALAGCTRAEIEGGSPYAPDVAPIAAAKPQQKE